MLLASAMLHDVGGEVRLAGGAPSLQTRSLLTAWKQTHMHQSLLLQETELCIFKYSVCISGSRLFSGILTSSAPNRKNAFAVNGCRQNERVIKASQ